MINLDSIHIKQTYGGCLEGVPPVDGLIKSAQEQAIKMFGKRPIVVLDYETRIAGKNRLGEERHLLPKWQHIAWMSSYTPIKDGHGSHLIAIWFSDNPSCDMVPVIDKIDWGAHAEDWWM